jgi:hypothetical protein
MLVEKKLVRKKVEQKVGGEKIGDRKYAIKVVKKIITPKTFTDLLKNFYPLIHWLKCKNIYP